MCIPYIFLNPSKLHNTFVNRTLRDKSVYGDLAGLAQTVSTVHGLSVIRRIPIVVIEDHGICSSKIDTETAGTGTEQEDEDVRSGKRALSTYVSLTHLKISRTSFAIP